jgi:phosphate transport system permease protein
VVDRIGDGTLYGLTAAAAVLVMLIIAAIIWKVVQGAWPAVQHFGISFVWHGEWNPVIGREAYGAKWFIIGTVVSAFGAMLLAAPLAVAIGLFLSELAHPRIRGPIASLIEMLAAVPSVVIGLWGILVLGPVMRADVEPFLHHYFGWIPIFGGSPSQSGMLVAIVVLTMMALPIISSICRELFLSVPQDVKEASIGLGATRWEMVRTVIVPHVRGGVLAGIVLGLGRALGEAIAVTQVIGNTLGPLHLSLFAPANALASQIAANYQGASTNLQLASLVYLALILLVITFVANLLAQRIVLRFDRTR